MPGKLRSVLSLAVVCGSLQIPAVAADPPKGRWTLDAGFKLEPDTSGYELPTAIAFVPHGGSGAKDPLYFVVELRGKLKVVTNDRTVLVFDEGFAPSEFTAAAPPDGTAEFGAAGICLDPRHGYVFVTFAYQDKDKLLRNDVIRYSTQPETFAVHPSGRAQWTDLFRPFKSGVSHQIGPCQVVGDVLYLSVGDGFDTPSGSQRTDTLLGKILRLTLDGKPAPGNPFEDPFDPLAVENYVWAYGLRNPFGLRAVQGRLFTADNGLSTDRFLEVRAGENYLWDGTERSMAINVAAVVAPSVGPVQMDYLPADSSLFPESSRDRFYVALSGSVPGIMTFDYDFRGSKMRTTPQFFMQYVGKERNIVTGLAFGPDGLYFSPIGLPSGQAPPLSTIYRIREDASVRTGTLMENPNPWVLMYEKGCFGCHSMTGLTRGGNIGPRLDPAPLLERLARQLESAEYLASLDEMDRLDEEPQRSFRKARQEIREAKGLERIRKWVYYRVQEPRFDRILSAMPNCNVSAPEAKRITDLLVKASLPRPSWKGRVARLLPRSIDRKQLPLWLGGAFAIGLGMGVAGVLLARRRRARTT